MPTIKHPFVSAVADGADATQVRPSNWNADHTITDLIVAASITCPYAVGETQGTITDATITTAHKVTVDWGNTTDTDENGPGMDPVTFRATPNAGSITVKVFSHGPDTIGGVFRLNYQAAT